MTESQIDHVTSACFEVLAKAPAGLFSDYDGTLSHVARVPAEAELAAGAGEALKQLVTSLDTVAIVTGRSAADAVARVPVSGLTVVGNHGLEQIENGVASIHPGAVEQVEAINTAVKVIEAQLRDHSIRPSLVIENKRLSASIHYRLADDPDAAHRMLIDLVGEQASKRNLVVTEGKLVLELRPAVEVNKGTAVSHLVNSRALLGAVMLGDDVTDVDAFLALRRQRDEGISTLSVAVKSSETPAAVLDAADHSLNGVEECVKLLEGLASLLSRDAP